MYVYVSVYMHMYVRECVCVILKNVYAPVDSAHARVVRARVCVCTYVRLVYVLSRVYQRVCVPIVFFFFF